MKRKTLVVNQGLPRLRMYSFELFGRTAARLDAGARGGEECSCGSDYGKDRGWVFGGLYAAILRVERVSDEEEGEAEKKEGGFLH